MLPVWLIILLCIVALLLLLLLVPIPLRLVFSFEGSASLELFLQCFGIPISLFSVPEKKKRPNIKHFTKKYLKKLGEKQEKKAEKAARKREKKAAKKAAQAQNEEKPTARDRATSFLDTLRLVRKIVGIVFARFGRMMRIKMRYLDIRIATKDPAETAVLYGSVYAALEALWAEIAHTKPMKRVHKRDIAIYADFTAETPSARGDITFGIRLWQVLCVLIESGAAALSARAEKQKNETDEEKRARAEKRQRQEPRCCVSSKNDFFKTIRRTACRSSDKQ